MGKLNYSRMFMGPRFADIARPLMELTKKACVFNWTSEHTAAVSELKKNLIGYNRSQILSPGVPYELYTDPSGYATGDVLEQGGKRVGFL